LICRNDNLFRDYAISKVPFVVLKDAVDRSTAPTITTVKSDASYVASPSLSATIYVLTPEPLLNWNQPAALVARAFIAASWNA